MIKFLPLIAFLAAYVNATSYKLSEINTHNTQSDFWIVMGSNVYSFQSFSHPGGWSVIQPYAGGAADATSRFNNQGHSSSA